MPGYRPRHWDLMQPVVDLWNDLQPAKARKQPPRVGIFVDGSRSAIHRPMFDFYWLDNHWPEASLSWGDGNGDPVWIINVSVRLGDRLGAVVDRYYERRAERRATWNPPQAPAVPEFPTEWP